MKIGSWKRYRSHGDGSFDSGKFRSLGENVVFERGVLIFHQENISIGNNVYVGHNSILKGYYRNEMHVGDNTWIGQGCFISSAGGLSIGKAVGIGPMVKILTSSHSEDAGPDAPVMAGELVFRPVTIGDGCDIGAGSVILPGANIGEGSIVGAGAVVTGDIEPFSVYAGVPARKLRDRMR
jgi:acetyltransferase-like isoleucine patch superfamily enzyme